MADRGEEEMGRGDREGEERVDFDVVAINPEVMPRIAKL